MCYGLRLVVLDSEDALVHAENLLLDSSSYDYLLSFFEKGAEVRGQIWFPLAAVDDQALALFARGKAELDMCRECGSAESDAARKADLFEHGLSIVGDVSDKGVGAVYVLLPLVALDLDSYVSLFVTLHIQPRSYGLYGS